MSTPVFDVVHEFSGRGISAVPIIDDDGIVVNLYETVDVIVRFILLSHLRPQNHEPGSHAPSFADIGTVGSLSVPGLDNRSGAQRALSGLSGRRHLHRIRLPRNAPPIDQQTPGASVGYR